MNDNDDDAVEIWDIKHAYTAAERASSGAKLCMSDKCSNVAVAAWASSKEPDSYWETCEDCQVHEFGGWPEDFELPEGFETDDGGHDSDNEEKESPSTLPAANESPTPEVAASTLLPEESEPTSSCEEGQVEQESQKHQETTPTCADDESVEIWDIKRAYTAKERASSSAKNCMSDECTNVAFAAWASNKDPNNQWDTCEDCQVREFGGWPEDFEFPGGFDDDDENEDDSASNSSGVVPLKNPNTITHSASGKRKNKTANQITPPPNSIATTTTAAANNQKTSSKDGGSTFISPVPNNSNNKPSAAALAMHKKWQEAAESMNGGSTDVRIVLSKPGAKKLIYDCLYESFCPMNITDLYKVRLLMQSGNLHA